MNQTYNKILDDLKGISKIHWKKDIQDSLTHVIDVIKVIRDSNVIKEMIIKLSNKDYKG